MSIFDVDLFGRTKHGLAIERIRTFCAGRRTLVAFSGGKDSQCCYHLAREAGVEFEAQYSVTRFEPPELLQFIRANYPDVVFRRAYCRSLIPLLINSFRRADGLADAMDALVLQGEARRNTGIRRRNHWRPR